MDVRGGSLTTKQNRVKQKKHALYTWHTHTVPPIQWSRVHHTLVYHCSMLTALSSAHTRTHSPSCTEQGQAGLSCCSSVSYSQDTYTHITTLLALFQRREPLHFEGVLSRLPQTTGHTFEWWCCTPQSFKSTPCMKMPPVSAALLLACLNAQ